ncbi:membrane associated rhomboid family serine protease [Methylohalomonas lacus]|uniref:Membrane associated rhomboid family serine protease n=1 Tax=Methylohalomonas lacus TaxID=398773 RepID=A0AAE3L0Q7_9GAMM|nr:hypothetical protein [Methylohalomonas lacus]MCS3902455.1 membrane associated rhomboid family serine protease [Methylohalomonas lacus]
MALIGKWAFIAGLVIAVLAGFGLDYSWVTWVLAILGLVVGFLNVGEQETQTFLLAAIGMLMSASAISVIPYIGDIGTAIIANVVAFISAAILVVTLRSLFVTARH